MAKAVNNGTNFRGITIKLGADIDLNNIDWTPIGNYDNRFQGTFDGDGHTISNLKTSINEDYVGLFGSVDGGIVKNVTLINFDVSGDYSYVGGLVGFNDGGIITGNTVVGTANGTTTTFSNVGGLVGRNYVGTVSGNTFCSNKDAVGDSFGTVENNTRLYKITLLEGVTVDGEGLKTIDGVTYAQSDSTVKFTIKRGVTLSEKLDPVTVNGDIDLSGITVTDHWNALNGSDGSEENPYLISTVEGLQYLATYVNVVTNNDEKNCTGVHFKLTNDLDLSSVESWTPIGRSTSVWLDGVSDGAFNGTFDGDGHTISNLTITGTNGNVGLFGCVRYRGVVHDITLTNVNISGSGHVGGIVGENWGTVHNNTISGTIKGDDAVGGIVGFDGKIGYLGGTVHSNTVFSEVSGNMNVGGLAGYNGGDPITGGAIVRDNKYYSNKDAVGLNYEHGISSNNTRYYKLTLPEGVTVTGEPDTLSDGTNIYYTGNVTLNLADNPDDKYIKSTTYNADGTYTYTISDETPITIGNCPKIGNIVFDRATYQYLINTVEDLQTLAAYVNGGNDTTDLTFKLNADIDMSSVNNFTPIGNRNNQFAGTFDGGDFKISNLKINGDNHVGLFGDNKGTVKNVTLDNVDINGNLNVGGLVGWNSGTVSDSKVTGTVDGHYFIGGFVGQNNGGGPVTGNTFNGIVDGIEIVGGLVGWNKGKVTGGTVNATVNGNLNVGGLVGSNDGTVSDNIFYSNKNAVGNNSGTVENNTRYYKLTLPDGVTAEGDGVKTFGGVTYAISGSTVTFDTKPGVVLSEKLAPVTVTDDLDLKNGITVTDHWNVLNGGDGSEENPYLIGTVEGLQYLANYVNASDEYYYTNNENQCEGLNFKLTADIDMSGVDFTPVGDESNPFNGTFDGGDFKISNLKVSGGDDYVGLFGNVGTGGTVQNVALENVDIGGNERVGALVGSNHGTVTGGTVSGTVSGEYGVGGLIGRNNGAVTEGAFSGKVNGNRYIGGLVGQNSGGTVTGGFADATVRSNPKVGGGLVGTNTGTVNDNSYHSNKKAVGTNKGTTSNNTRLYKLTLPTGIVASGGGVKVIDGVTYATRGSNVTFAAKTGVVVSGKLSPVTVRNFDIDLSKSVTVKYYWGTENGADGSTANPFIINTTEDLQYLATYVNGGNDTSSLTFKLTGNIDMSGVENFAAIGNRNNMFSGTLDGAGYKISNLTVSGDSNVGLFGYNAGTIQNLTLANATVSGASNVGGLVGFNSGTVSGCKVTSKVSGGSYVGGLVGVNNGTVSGNFCHSNKDAVGDETETDTTKLYELTLPEGVTADVTKLIIGNKSYVTEGNVTLTAKDPDTGNILGTVSADVAEDVAIAANGDENNPYITITVDDKPTIYGGAGATIVTGGDALVKLDADSKRDGAVINVSGGRTTITGSNNVLGGFTGDTIAVDDLDITTTKFTFGGDSLTIKGANFHAIVDGVSTTGAGYMTQYLQNATDGTTYKAAIGGESSTMYVAADEDTRANAYIGKNGTVDFSNFTGSAVVDLGGDLYDSSIDGNAAYFNGVNQLVGGNGKTVFIGSDAKETLIAGAGNTSIYGGGGKNILSGYDGADKEGSTTFMVLGVNDGAVNTISGFEFVAEHNYIDAPLVTADQLETDIENNHFSDVAIVGDDLLIEVTGNSSGVSEKALLVGGAGKDFAVNGLVAQVGNDVVNVDDKAQYYLALGANATVNVGGSGDESIWLDDPDSGKEFEGDFTVIDARNLTGRAELAGNNLDNVIYAGSGNTSMWGGNGGNDLMYGGAGADEFFYAAGNGNDTINAGSGDSVYFVNITLDDITIDTVTSSAVAFSFKDGGKLTVNDGNNGVSFAVGNETYRLNGNREFE